MKKSILVLAFVTVAGYAGAQDIMSKKGTPILPEAGDFSIGIDAVPFLEYFGNLMNGSNSAPSFEFTATNPMTITGLYMKDANTAYRGKLRIGISTFKDEFATANDATLTDPFDISFDEVKTSSKNVRIGVGLQKFRGKHRVKGIYGGEVMIGLSSSKTEHDYANAITLTNPNPSTGIPGQPNIDGSRTTEIKSGSTFEVALRGFVGVEYFFAPKISISGEFGWGLNLASTGEGETEAEIFDGVSVVKRSSKTGKSSDFVIDTDNAEGSLNLHFYF